MEHICQRIVKCESWYDFVVLISKISDFPLFKGRRHDRMGRKVVEKLFFIRVFSFFFFFFQTKFICSLLIKGSIVRSSLCIIEQYFYSRDFIIKNRVLSGWIVQMENFILFFLGWNFWNIYFWRFSFFFFAIEFWSTVRWKLLGRRGKWNKCGDGFREFYLARSISHSGRKIVRRLSNENSIQKDLHIRF